MNIREIAKRAGVSIATVSRVINNPNLVQSEKRELVYKIMREENYTPTWTVESRLSSRSRVISFLFSESDFLFYYQVLSGLDSIAAHHNYTVTYCPISADPDRRAQQLETISCQKIDGAIWALRDFHPKEAERITSKEIPLVLARKYDGAPEFFNCCYINFTEGSFRMTQHLIGQGCRKIMLMVEKVSFQFVTSFYNGWKNAYIQNNLPYEEHWSVHSPNTIEGGYYKAKELLLSDDRPDAIFCASDEQAFGALKAAREIGINIPDELAVVGFTDSAMANLADPQLTTVDQPIHRLGVIAARMLFDLIEDEDLDLESAVKQEIVLQPKLRIRRSCRNKNPVDILVEQ